LQPSKILSTAPADKVPWQNQYQTNVSKDKSIDDHEVVDQIC
jgi:hypothetical protein